MKQKILIAGGDLRQIYCARSLADEYDAYITGFSQKYLPSDADLKYAELSEASGIYDAAVLPVPPLDENGRLNTPCSEEMISAEKIARLVKPNGLVFAGKVSSKLCEIFNGMEICDYMEREELSLLNAVPTAEGAVQIALEELPVTLSGLSVLIVGCGRIGTALIGILRGFGADVTVSVRNAEGAARARILGAKACRTSEIKNNFGLVFNTVPSMIFDKKLLEKFSRDTLFIDLASKPGGIDFEAAAELGIRAVWALGLPGKTAPITSGEMLAETVSGILAAKKDGEADG